MSNFAIRPTAARRLLAALISFMLTLLVFTPTSHAASNTFCPNTTPITTTTFLGGGNWGDGDYWSAGLPDGDCNAVIPAGDTVTLTTTPGTESDTFPGASAAGLTIEAGATVIVEGVSSDGEQGNVAQSTDLNVGSNGLTVAKGATLDLEATGNAAPSGAEPGQPLGGAANLQVDSATPPPSTLNNAGTIVFSSSDAAWGESLNVGGTVTNTGSIEDQSGLLTFQGENFPYIFNNTGTMSVSAGASFTMIAGDGSQFNNNAGGTFTNQGTATLQQSMHWYQNGGTETGNPVQITNGEELDDTSGAGNFEVSNCTTGGVVGTIPASQTITVLGGCSGTTLYIGGDNNQTVANYGTIILDTPATNGADGILNGGELDNYGTIDSEYAAGTSASSANQLLDTLVNESGATVNLTGGPLKQTAGTTTTNNGTVNMDANSLWLVQGGAFTNGGTIAPQVASATSLSQFNLTIGGKFNAGGTLAPTLASGYSPAKGTEFPFITYNGGSATGTFSSVTNGFSADYKKETLASNAYVGLIYGGAASAGKAPKVGKLAGGVKKLTLKLSCAKGKACAKYTFTGTSLKKTVLSGSGTLKAGKSVTRTLKLNRAGAALLKKHGKLKIRFVIKASGKTVESKTVTVTWRK
jgi:hypothetical protein